MKILFVCRGNVGRSQIAEALFNKETNGEIEAISAGTKLSGPEQPIGKITADVKNVFEVMKEDGLDISKNIRKQLTKEMADSADKIIFTVDERDPIPDYLIGNPKVIKWHVIDPKGQSLEFTRKSRDQIKELIKDLIKDINRNL
ncbi:MAG: low molecular weight phosphatase family protein [Candidatus Paceibacterota bacterium]|jgi:protein-tyrosine-phosphatase